MFLDNDKTFLIIHYGLRNGTLVKSTVLRWIEAVQAKRIKLSYTFCSFGIICGLDLYVPGLSFVLKRRFFGNILNPPAEQITSMKNVLLKHNSRFCMVYTIIFIDYKVKRAFNVTQILGGLFYILDHQNPRDVLAALAIFQNHLQSCLYNNTYFLSSMAKAWNFPPFTPKQVFCSSITRNAIFTETHTMGLENHCWADWDMAAKWTGSGSASPPWKQALRSINQISNIEKKKEKRKMSRGCRRYNWPLLFCRAQLCWGPQSFETNSRHVKPKLDNEVPGLPDIPVCRCECKW